MTLTNAKKHHRSAKHAKHSASARADAPADLAQTATSTDLAQTATLDVPAQPLDSAGPGLSTAAFSGLGPLMA